MAIRKNGIPARAIAHLETLGAGARLSSEDLAAALNYEGGSIAQILKAARRDELLCADPEGGTLMWFIPEAQDDTPVEFNAALYLDGDLVIYGAQLNEDDSVTVNAKQLAHLKKLIAWSPAP